MRPSRPAALMDEGCIKHDVNKAWPGLPGWRFGRKATKPAELPTSTARATER